MKYANPQLRDALAAEYALGTLQGSARRRFERLLKSDPQLRQLVAGWQERLAPLDALAEPLHPPARVWRSIQQRIEVQSGRRDDRQGFWASLGFWRGATVVSTLAAVVLAVSLVLIPPAKPPSVEQMVVVMMDEKATPAMTVSWPPRQKGLAKVRIHVVQHATMSPGTSWELWMLPGGEQKPVSLGLLNTDQTQELSIPSHLVPVMDAAAGLAMSVEPAGGSPTGLPTGPVIYSGQLTRL